MFEIKLTKTFAKELKKLESKETKRIKEKIKETSKNPIEYWLRLTGHELYRLRVGKYRVIAQISLQQKQITLLSVKHRKNVYDNL